MTSIAFFNNKGGVGKTSLVHHLAWMFATNGVTTLAVDLDPQANLTSMFLPEEALLELWGDHQRNTLFDCLRPLLKGTGDISPPHVARLEETLGLIPGHLALSRFEDRLSENWPKCLDRNEAAFRVITAFHRIILKALEGFPADLVLIDVGPNLGAINRSALIAADRVILPLAPDLFSLQGMENLGPTLRQWREEWRERLRRLPPDADLPSPAGTMEPSGYVVMQHGIRDNRPVKAYQQWMDRIPRVYREAVLDESPTNDPPPIDGDPHNLAQLKHYRSLMPLAQEARKPMFSLKPADGAIGSHLEAVSRCREDFHQLARRIARNAGIPFG